MKPIKKDSNQKQNNPKTHPKQTMHETNKQHEQKQTHPQTNYQP